nr:Nucleoredoxin 3 [Ipomoea batatas]
MEDESEGRLWQHFSHAHLLVLGNPPPEENPVCHGCKTTIFPAKPCYMCRKCPFFLHQVCFGMPKTVHHPVDPHALDLSSQKISAPCKACGQLISTFYYGCVKCQSFYHILCLAMPVSVKVPSHPHALTLEFSPPYDFRCDLCARPCYASHAAWLYHCGLCEFDVHISCAVTNRGARFLHDESPGGGDDGCRAARGSKRHEFMELLWRGINRNHQETPGELDDVATPSYQFSDACFSIDFAISVLDDEEGALPEHGGKITAGGYVNLPKPAAAPHHHHAQRSSSSLDFMSESSKRELNVKISSPISSRVWMEIDPESKKRDFQTQKSQIVNFQVKEKRSCCW